MVSLDRAGVRRPAGDSGPVSPRPAVQDLVAAGFGAVVVVAVHLDGRAHLLNMPDGFLTPWHGLLYGGVLALIGWLLVIGRAHGGRWAGLLAMPVGYGLALAGGGLFLVGGGLDLLWHTAFGIESGIDALVSPSHLWLFTAGALLLSGPVRAVSARRRVDPAPTGPALAAVLLGVASLAGLAGFVLAFLSAYTNDAPSRPMPHYPEGTPEHAAVEIPASWGLASYVITSLVLAVPLAWLILRARLPFGAATAYAAGLALLGVTVVDFEGFYGVAAGGLAGLVVDTFLLVAHRRGVKPRVRAVVSAGLLPAVGWTAQLAGIAYTDGIGWSAELVAGVVVLSSLLSALAAVFLATPVDQEFARVDQVSSRVEPSV